MNLAALNNFDYLVLFIIFLSVLFGFLKGFIQSVLSLVGWVAAAVFTYLAFPIFKPFMLSHLHNEMVVNVGGPVVIYFVILIVISLLNNQIVSTVGALSGGGIDRSAGLAFGLARGFFFTSLIFTALTMVSPSLINDQPPEQNEKNIPDWVRGAQTIGLLKVGREMIVSWVPQDISAQLAELFGSSKQKEEEPLPFAETAAIIRQMQLVLPKEMRLNHIDTTVDPANKEAQEKQKEVFRIILQTYKAAAKSGKIPADLQLPETLFNSADIALFPRAGVIAAIKEKQNERKNPSDDMPGYNKKQVNEFDRLIQTVQ